MFLSSWSPCQARLVWSLTAQHWRPPCVPCLDSFGGTVIDFSVWTPLRLPLGHRLSAIHLSTTSRPPLWLWLLSLLPSTARCSWLRWCRPVWWSWPLIRRPGRLGFCFVRQEQKALLLKRPILWHWHWKQNCVELLSGALSCNFCPDAFPVSVFSVPFLCLHLLCVRFLPELFQSFTCCVIPAIPY